jgi:hypothetical protein
MHVFSCYLIVDTLVHAYDVVAQSHWFDATSIEEQLREQIVNGNRSLHDIVETWHDEASLEGYSWLKWVSLFSVVGLLLTWFVCIYLTVNHVRKVTYSVNRHEMRDTTIQIVLLPMVYGIMSFKSVVRMWEISCASPLRGSDADWYGRRKLFLDLYRSNLSVADVYEAWTLLSFAWMTVRIINKETLINIKKLKAAAEIRGWNQPSDPIEDEEPEVDKEPSDPTEGTESSDPMEEDNDRLRETEKLTRNLQESVGSLALQGIQAFVFVCFAEALYDLSLTGCKYYNLDKWVDYSFLVTTRSSTEMFFRGAGLVASSSALANLVGVEMKFHKELETFQPFYKFWAAKILVSFAFVQEIALCVPPLNALTETRGNLLFASALCMECFVVALLMLKAWNPEPAPKEKPLKNFYTKYSRFEMEHSIPDHLRPLVEFGV